MKKQTIYIKENKATKLWEYIETITNEQGMTIYKYYNGKSVDQSTKSTFNKASFIEYLKSIQIAKKVIKQVTEL